MDTKKTVQPVPFNPFSPQVHVMMWDPIGAQWSSLTEVNHHWWLFSPSSASGKRRWGMWCPGPSSGVRQLNNWNLASQSPQLIKTIYAYQVTPSFVNKRKKKKKKRPRTCCFTKKKLIINPSGICGAFFSTYIFYRATLLERFQLRE